MREGDWEAPIVELSRPLTAYLVWLVGRDLAEWRPDRRTRLTQEEATAFAEFLSSFLPAQMRTEAPAVPPLLKVG